ncbi:response regulator [Hirschia baltica]|uniref:Response regulator receiver protein n=1 Tax=Hirschia baltica (strain ATCC 49814 / DSM 5838 / IFAM 1418) TaxID=582402 RepID=C6XJK4_HIRBI|nr:response regulator [Hirschia baltica]ACT59299.1 response regulator receiver protein [Hirschia baltica ATCC 49814]
MVIDNAQKSRARNPSILVVDDHANISKLVEAYIIKAGLSHIRIQHADCLEIACLKIESDTPDLILLDNLLPPHFDFRQSIKELDGAFSGPIILFSSEIPINIGEEDADQRLAAIISKDDISSKNFIETIQQQISI